MKTAKQERATQSQEYDDSGARVWTDRFYTKRTRYERECKYPNW